MSITIFALHVLRSSQMIDRLEMQRSQVVNGWRRTVDNNMSCVTRIRGPWYLLEDRGELLSVSLPLPVHIQDDKYYPTSLSGKTDSRMRAESHGCLVRRSRPQYADAV